MHSETFRTFVSDSIAKHEYRREVDRHIEQIEITTKDCDLDDIRAALNDHIDASDLPECCVRWWWAEVLHEFDRQVEDHRENLLLKSGTLR